MSSARSRIAGIVLAAGSSSRMGKPKQLLSFKASTLLQHVIRSVQNSGCTRTLVVTGASRRTVAPLVCQAGAVLVENTAWEEGIASSIRAGVQAAMQSDPNLEGILIVLADQPLVTSAALKNLVQRFQAGQSSAVGAEYAGQVGVPAIFSRRFFPELLSLTGMQGAKRILVEYRAEIDFVSLPEAALDVDTPEDYQALLMRQTSR